MDCCKCKIKKVDQKSIGDKCFYCDGCKRVLCESCSSAKFSSTEIRVLQLKKDRILRYFCSQCALELSERKDMTTSMDKMITEATEKVVDKVLKKISEEIKELMECKIGQIKEQLNTVTDSLLSEVVKEVRDNKIEHQPSKVSETYADKLRKANNQTLVIRPKVGQVQGRAKTSEIVKKAVDPTELGIGVTKVKGVKDGGLVVCLEDNNDREKLKIEVEKKLGQQYDIKEVQKWKPRVKVVGIYENLSKDEMKECIMKQNSFVQNESDVEVIIVKKVKNKFMAILEVSADTFRKIMEAGKLRIRWSVCRVFECFDILRCYRCLGFNHKAENCRNLEENGKVCSRCGGQDHREKECREEERKCVNCVRANRHFNMNLDIYHGAFDNDCSVLLRQMERKRERIEYNN